MRQPCHARKQNSCGITEYRTCPENCVFYKTEKQFRADFLRSKRRLDSLGLTGDMRRQYAAFNRMCRQFTNERRVSK